MASLHANHYQHKITYSLSCTFRFNKFKKAYTSMKNPCCHRLCVLLSATTACGINEFLYRLVLWCGCLSRPLRSIRRSENSVAKGWVVSLSIFLALTVTRFVYSSSKSLCLRPVTCPAFLVILFSLDLSLSVTFPPQQTTPN